jgi:hypothetical protein
MTTTNYPEAVQRAITRTEKRGWMSKPDLATFVANAEAIGDVTTFMREMVAAFAATNPRDPRARR